MDGDSENCHRLPLINLSRILNNSFKSSTDAKLKKKSKAGFSKNAYVNRCSDHETVTPSSDTYLGIESIQRRGVNRRHLRKSSVDFKGLKNKLSSYKIAKGKVKEMHLKSHQNLYDVNKHEGFKKGSRKYLLTSSISEMKCSKSNSSDLFGFRRCHRTRRSFDYNMSVIYKLLGKECLDKNSQHEILKCKHYSIEDVPGAKKKSPLVNIECEKPTRYTVINFNQCDSTTDTYMVEPKKKKLFPASCPCLECNKNKSILKKVNRIKSCCVQPPAKIATEKDSCKSVCTQPIKIRTKEKNLATVGCPVSKPCSLRKTVVNVCQHSKTNFQYPRPVSNEKREKCNICEKSKETVGISSKVLAILNFVLRHFLSGIVLIVWLPVIIIGSFFWLISYPFRPHCSSENTTCKHIKTKTRCKQKDRNRKNKCRNKRYVNTNKCKVWHAPKWLPHIPFNLYVQKIFSNLSMHSKKTLWAPKKSGVCFFKPATTTIAFPCEGRKANKERKRRKSVTFQQPSRKCNSPIPMQNPQITYGCPEIYLKMKQEAPCENSRAEKLQSPCGKKKKTRKQKAKNVDVCVSDKLFTLLHTTLEPSYSSKDKDKGYVSCIPIQNPKSKNICKSNKNEQVKPIKTCDKKLSPVCSKDFCLSSYQKKTCPPFETVSVTSKKSAKVQSCKSNAVVKYLPPPPKCGVNKCLPPEPAPICKVDSDMATTSVIKFFPCPRRKMQSASCCMTPKPSKITKEKTKKKRQRTTRTNTLPLPSVVKFLPPPKRKKMFKTKVTGTAPLQKTSVLKLVPTPAESPDQKKKKKKKKSSDEEGLDEEETDEEASDDEESDGKGRKSKKKTKSKGKQAGSKVTVVKFFATPSHSKRTLATNTKNLETPSKKKHTSLIKFFPAPRHRTRTFGSSTKLDEKDRCGKKIGTRSRKIETKTPMHIIKFYPKRRTKTKNQSVAMQIDKEKSQKQAGRSRTSIIKVFPPPRHKTRSLTTNTSAKMSSLVYQTSSKKKKSKEKLDKKSKEKPDKESKEKPDKKSKEKPDDSTSDPCKKKKKKES